MLLFITSWLLILLLSIYFLRRKRFDVISISFFGSLIYFIPAIIPSELVYINNVFIYWIALIFTVGAAIIFDSKNKEVESNLDEKIKIHPIDIIKTCAVATAIVLVLQITNYGINDFFSTKQEQVRSGHLSVIYSVLVTIGFIYSINNKCKIYIYYFLLHELFIFISGDRTNFAIAALSYILIKASMSKKFIKEIISIRVLLVCLSLLIIGTNGKEIYVTASYTYIYGGNFIENFKSLNTDEKNILESIRSTEPYGIDKMLGIIIETNFEINSSYLINTPLQLLPFSGSITNSLHYFSNTIKSQFYSDWGDKSGVGATFFGEGYANFGAAGLFLFLMIFIGAAYILNYKFTRSPRNITPIYAILSSYWGFYIHRNSLFQMISHTTKYVYIFILIMFLIWTFRKIFKYNP